MNAHSIGNCWIFLSVVLENLAYLSRLKANWPKEIFLANFFLLLLLSFFLILLEMSLTSAIFASQHSNTLIYWKNLHRWDPWRHLQLYKPGSAETSLPSFSESHCFSVWPRSQRIKSFLGFCI